MRNAQSYFGYIPKCYYFAEQGSQAERADCRELTNKFLESLKIIKTCENKAYENGCIPEYKGFDDIIKDVHKDDEDYDEEYWQDYATRNCEGFNTSKILNEKTVYVLADGTILFFFFNHSCVILAFDTNGMQGPNKWGYDLFAVTLQTDGNYFTYGNTGCMPVEKNGKSFNAMYKAAFNR